MILSSSDVGCIDLLTADLVVVGAGPAGIVLAIELAERGFDIVLAESGLLRHRESVQALSDAASPQSQIHAPMSIAVRRQVGGTSAIWGGRCVPYDPVDFETRAFAGSAEWPIGYGEVCRYHQRACEWLQCGRAVFDAEETQHLPKSIVPALRNGDLRTSALERWSLPTNFGTTYMQRLRRSSRLRLLTGYTAMELIPGGEGAGRRVESIKCRSFEGRDLRLKGRAYVLAAGGLESTRLLMASRGLDGEPIGGHSGHLGRWYMSHVEGVVSDIVFKTPPKQTIFDYERDIDGVYVRRRFTFAEDFTRSHDLPNFAAWIANPGLADASHRSGPLSFAFLALESPMGKRLVPDAQRLSLTGRRVPGAPYGPTERSPVAEHLKNMADQPIETARFITSFGARRFLLRRRPVPGFFVSRPSNHYPFQYHSEHGPNPMSSVSLSNQRDQLGMPRLNIALAFSDSDVDGVVRAHAHVDSHLRRQGIGYLEYHHDDVADAVRLGAGGGFHQMGTTRMSRHPRDGVVDSNLAVHGYPNAYVLSSSTFVTSGQANSTFLIIAMATRLGDHLTTALRG